MADEQQLWSNLGKEIIANPGNDELRYQFATYPERDEPEDSRNRDRAEFLRLQLKLSPLSPNHREYMRLANQSVRLGDAVSGSVDSVPVHRNRRAGSRVS